ncbi:MULTISPECIES: MSMEG_0570 family nitrogen starvation response protein [Gordonia]|uniref:MSMEG_0570 family nitrogen starvation response protein n=1 Tax=Gordonia hongkongensis TaxID=1701090 RepID=A0ABT6BQW2_9ACTN|nr:MULTISPECIES: MSMEG_0570 family nitrogen starvation response protein [Gordonia]MBN0975281.1 MSMEG_0570 family nitrogen starvation response protein [Gordonia sp. BP-119]MBN0981370.1 MSMEG_0570 family nitrogen starvation response protein [Gordonia sp. BP-94]MDF6100364.1 MSMEG_0570 family nitrogen starvation response protein [Gordonia hongkongensis]
MPEMTVQVRWPDGLLRQYYSPSLVLHDHLAPGTYRVDDFRSRATTALDEASARVRAKYGFACTSAAASAEEIAIDAGRHSDSAEVEVVSMYPPLPGAEVASTRGVASLRPGSTSSGGSEVASTRGVASLRPGSTSGGSGGTSSEGRS